MGCDISQIRCDFVLRDVQVANDGVVPTLERDRLPYAHGYEAWTPIPSILIGCLARVRIGTNSLLHVGVVYGDRGQVVGQELNLLKHLIDGRAKHYLKSVRSRL